MCSSDLTPERIAALRSGLAETNELTEAMRRSEDTYPERAAANRKAAEAAYAAQRSAGQPAAQEKRNLLLHMARSTMGVGGYREEVGKQAWAMTRPTYGLRQDRNTTFAQGATHHHEQ